MVIKRTIDKETVKDLPKAAFPGQIHVVQTPWEAEKAVAYLKSCPLLGIDSETRPSFTKGQIHKVALLQISSEEHCFLVPPQPDGTDSAGYHIAGKPKCNESRPFLAG